jgi:hypothetical protein
VRHSTARWFLSALLVVSEPLETLFASGRDRHSCATLQDQRWIPALTKVFAFQYCARLSKFPVWKTRSCATNIDRDTRALVNKEEVEGSVRLRVHVCYYAEHLTDAVSIGVVSESHAAWFRICSPCFACPSSIASWSKRARRQKILDVKLTFARMQNRLFPFDAQEYSFKQGDRRSFSSCYVRRAIADFRIMVDV